MLGLRKIRKAKGFKQYEAADALGIKHSAYSHYENGFREPTLSTLVKMSEFFGVSIHYLVTGEEFQPHDA
jgi:transcriptional regulator with XRE-family HTH domain